MAEYSEEQQVEAIRKWVAENGMSVAVAIVIALSALIGWRHWQGTQRAEAEAASVVFQQMLEAVDDARAKPDSEQESLTVKLTGEKLITEFPDSAYADYAQLMLAKLAVERLEYDVAIDNLKVVIDAPASDTIRWAATLRLARVLLQTGDHEGALALVEGKVPEAYKGQALEIKGDVLRVREDFDGARSAYELAVENMDGDAHKELVRMKLQDLAPAS